MGHVINHIVVDRDVDKEAVLNEIREEVMHEDWAEGGFYHGNLKWKDEVIYGSYEEAMEAIERLEGGRPYRDYAVLFRDLERVEKTRAVLAIEERIAEVGRSEARFLDSLDVHARASNTVTCKVCGSRFTISYLPPKATKCPVCHGSLLSESTRSKIRRYRERIAELERKRAEELKKGAERATVRWLVKYEYHV